MHWVVQKLFYFLMILNSTILQKTFNNKCWLNFSCIFVYVKKLSLNIAIKPNIIFPRQSPLLIKLSWKLNNETANHVHLMWISIYQYLTQQEHFDYCNDKGSIGINAVIATKHLLTKQLLKAPIQPSNKLLSEWCHTSLAAQYIYLWNNSWKPIYQGFKTIMIFPPII